VRDLHFPLSAIDSECTGAIRAIVIRRVSSPLYRNTNRGQRIQALGSVATQQAAPSVGHTPQAIQERRSTVDPCSFRSAITICLTVIPRGSYVWDLSAHSILGRSRVPLPQGSLLATAPLKTWLLGSSASALHKRLASFYPSKGIGPNTRSRAASSECSVWGKPFLMRPPG
jgi:hypothetical protein